MGAIAGASDARPSRSGSDSAARNVAARLPDLRPRSAPEVIDASIELARRNFSQLLAVAALVVAAAVPLSLIQRHYLVPPGYFRLLVGFHPAALARYAVLGIGFGLLVQLLSDAYLTGTSSTAAAWARMRSRMLPLAIVAASSMALVSTGLMLLLIPGIVIARRLFAAMPAVVLERLGPWDALRRSVQLTRASPRLIAGTVILTAALYIVLRLGVVLVLEGLLDSTLRANIAASALGVFLLPVLAAVVTVTYYQLRIEQEAFDLELLSASVGAPAASPGEARTSTPHRQTEDSTA